MRNSSTSERIHPGVRLGHVHLKVADLDRALGFYQGVLGLDVTQRLGNSAAFLSAGGYHHHIGLTHGRAAKVTHLPQERLACIISPCFIRQELPWQTRLIA